MKKNTEIEKELKREKLIVSAAVGSIPVTLAACAGIPLLAGYPALFACLTGVTSTVVAVGIAGIIIDNATKKSRLRAFVSNETPSRMPSFNTAGREPTERNISESSEHMAKMERNWMADHLSRQRD